ncbi:hypothetical protein LSCM1_00844 [Leishmania martiniquensis]|uniref:F-box domain-containing protein n=1 Tax=Leishmania martiniquensis TaxID=1580590 RepID=A0A836GXL9_9TRYP|nr:hypothetical protein LSCM1_00844 [Leishmania martiniquensis]
MRSRACFRSQATPHAQRRSSSSPAFTSKTAAHAFSQKKSLQEHSAPHQPSSPHATPLLSPPAAASYPSQEAKTHAATLTGSNAGGVPTSVTASSLTLLATDDPKAKDGMRRPPLWRPSSPSAEFSSFASGATPQQRPLAWQQSTGDRCAPPARLHIARDQALSRGTRSVAYASSSSSCASSSPTVSDTQSTTWRACGSTGREVARWARRSLQWKSHRNRHRVAITAAAAAHTSASSTTTKSSKASRLSSKQQWARYRVALRGVRGDRGNSSPSSVASRGGTKSAIDSSDSRPSRRRGPSQMSEDGAFLSSPSFTSVEPICVLTDVLPRDVYLHICGFLSEVDCCTLLEVNLRMHAAITSADSIVWRHMCMRTWMYKQGFQAFIQRARALEVLARQEELEVQALQQHMLLLREQGTIFGESDVSATCDCATVLMRRRQHARAQWMAAAAATAANVATPTPYRTRSTNTVSSATTSASSTTQTGGSSETKSGRCLHRQSRRSRHRHRGTRRSTTATTSTSRRSGNMCATAEKRPTHAAQQVERPQQRPDSRSGVTTATSKASRRRRNPTGGFCGDEGASESLSRSCSSQAWSSSGSSTAGATHSRAQTYPPTHHRFGDSEDRLYSRGAGADEEGCSAACRPPLLSSPSSSHTHALTEPRERGSGSSSSVLRSANASDGEEEEVDEPLRTNSCEKIDKRERRVCIYLPEVEAEVDDQDGDVNLTDTSVVAVRSEGGSRHRWRGGRSLCDSQLAPAEYHGHNHWHDALSRQQQQQHQCLSPPGSGLRRSRRERRRKPARQRRRKHSRSRGPRSTGGGGGRHRSQRHRGHSRHRPSHQRHHSPKATKSSRRRRRRQRNAATAGATRPRLGNGSTSANTSSQSAATAAVCGKSNTYFYQTATYAAIKSTTPVLAAQHVAPSVVPFKLASGPVPSASAAEAFTSQSLSKTQQHSLKPRGGEVHMCEASVDGAFAQAATSLNMDVYRAQMVVPAPPQRGSTSFLVMTPQAVATSSSAVASSGAGPNAEGLYWWQLTPEARQRQLRRMQQQQLGASSGVFATRVVPSLQDRDELADEAALREWDELEDSSFRSSSIAIDEEGTDESLEGESEEGYGDRNGASFAFDGTDKRSELSTDDDDDESEGSTDSGDHRRRRRRSRKLWRAQSRSARQAIPGDSTTTTARRQRSHSRIASGETGTCSSASTSSHTHTAPPSPADGESVASEYGIGNKKWRACVSARGAASSLQQRCMSSGVTGKRSRAGRSGTGSARSNGGVDRYDTDESAAVTSAFSEFDEELIAGSAGSSCRTVLPHPRRTRHPNCSPGISVAAPALSSSRAAIRAERRVAKALAKRYEGIEEAMVITRSKSVLIHTLERQTHAHLPRLLAAAALRQRWLMMSTRPAGAAAAANLHADPSLMSPTVAPHRDTPEFPGAASVTATRAMILIGAGSSGFNGGGLSPALQAAAPLTASPVSHLPSSLDNPFAAITAATVAVPASPVHQLARITSSNALISASGELSGRVSGTVPFHDGSPFSSSAMSTASSAGDGSSTRTEAHTLLRSLSEHHHAAAAAGGGSGFSGAALSSAGGVLVHSTNDEVVDEDIEEEQLAPVSWKFAFFMSRREAQRANITLQDLLEGMWVACFRSSGRTHPIRFVRQHQVFVYPPLPTEEEEQQLQQSGLDWSEGGDVTTMTAAASANWTAPPLPFHILQGGAQLVVHQFLPMKVLRRNAAAPATAAVGGMPTSSASAPTAEAVTPAMMAERRFAAEPHATLRKLRLRMLSYSANDAVVFKEMTHGSAPGSLTAGGCAVHGGPNGDAVREFGSRDCACADSCKAAAVASTAKANDARRAIVQRLGASAAYINEVLGQPPVAPGAEHASKGEGLTARRGCSVAACPGRKQRVFYGPPTQREYEAQQRREACFEPGGAGDVLNDWGWTIASQHVKIFSLDVTAPLYVEQLHRIAGVEVIGRRCGGVHETGI